MGLSTEMRRLENKWQNNAGWPKRLEYIEINGIRGWTGQRIDFLFPIVAIVGENGAGKSTAIQCAASVYAPEHYPSDFFPDTPWEVVEGASLKYAVREGDQTKTDSLRKLKRWRGYNSRPNRHVDYIDLSRVQPVSARIGFQRLANPQFKEDISNTEYWDEKLVGRLSSLMGRKYAHVRMAAVSEDKDPNRKVPILQLEGQKQASGFHSGQGETTIAEFLKKPFRDDSLVLIDEIETSLHPKVQRRIIRALADLARQQNLQIILTTHSPYILEELPAIARIYIMNEPTGRTIATGVSPEFAMTRMDDHQHPECNIYVEDPRSAEWVRAILAIKRPDLFVRCTQIPYGAASVGYALGQMVDGNRFPTPSCVFIDGDQQSGVGCRILPGEDAPERVIFEALKKKDWVGLAAQLGRSPSDVADSCANAMSFASHREWVKAAADKLLIGGDILWHALCACWVNACITTDEEEQVIRPIADALETA